VVAFHAWPVTGDVVFVSIQTDKDFDQYKGKLEGKVVLFGAMREVPPVDKACSSATPTRTLKT